MRGTKKKQPKLTQRGERGKSYLNDIVAGVHAQACSNCATGAAMLPVLARGTRKADSSTSAISDVCP